VPEVESRTVGLDRSHAGGRPPDGRSARFRVDPVEGESFAELERSGTRPAPAAATARAQRSTGPGVCSVTADRLDGSTRYRFRQILTNRLDHSANVRSRLIAPLTSPYRRGVLRRQVSGQWRKAASDQSDRPVSDRPTVSSSMAPAPPHPVGIHSGNDDPSIRDALDLQPRHDVSYPQDPRAFDSGEPLDHCGRLPAVHDTDQNQGWFRRRWRNCSASRCGS